MASSVGGSRQFIRQLFRAVRYFHKTTTATHRCPISGAKLVAATTAAVSSAVLGYVTYNTTSNSSLTAAAAAPNVSAAAKVRHVFYSSAFSVWVHRVRCISTCTPL